MKQYIKFIKMSFLLKICILSIIIKCMLGEPQCLFSDKNVRPCQDWKNMSAFVADMVGRSSVIRDKVNIKSNILTLLIRAASGVIGRGTNALQTLIVNGLMLLTQTILTISEYRIFNYNGTSKQKMNFFPGDRPIDWIMNNPYIKSMKARATDEALADRLGQQLGPDMPCVRLLVCRLSPVIRHMQRRVTDETDRTTGGRPARDSWSSADWRRANEAAAEHCAQKLSDDCADTVGRRR